MKGLKKLLTYIFVIILFFTVFLSVNNKAYALGDGQHIMHIVTTPGEDTSKQVTINYHSKNAGSYVEYTFASDTKFENATKVEPNEELWSTEGIKNTSQDSTFYTEKRYVCNVRLDNLEARTKYIYRVVEGSHISNTNSFTTSGLTNTWNFVAYTDFQHRMNTVTLPLIEQMREIGNDPSLMLCSGDMVDVSGNEEEWTWLLDNDTFKDYIFACSPGDHEYWADSINGKYPQYDKPYTYNKLFANPENGCSTSPNSSYYFYFNNVLFVALDMNNSDVSSGARFKDQVTWFKETMDKLKGTYQYVIVYEHKSVFGSAKEDSQVSANIRPQWYPVFKQYNVDLVLSGHDHMYSRTYQLNGNVKSTNSLVGTYYLDMGSSGDKWRAPDSTVSEKDGIHEKVYNLSEMKMSCAANIEINEQNMVVTVYNQNGKSVDSFTIKAKREANKVDCSAFNEEKFFEDISIKMTETVNNAGVLNFNGSLQAKYIKSIEVKNNNEVAYQGSYNVNGKDSFSLKNLKKLNCDIYVTLLDGTVVKGTKAIDFAVDKELRVEYSPFKLYFYRDLTKQLVKENSLKYKLFIDNQLFKEDSFKEDYIELEDKYYEGNHEAKLEIYDQTNKLITEYNLTIKGLEEFELPLDTIELKINAMASFYIEYKYLDLLECDSDLVEIDCEAGYIKGVKAGEGVATIKVKGTNISKTLNVSVVDPNAKAKSGCNSAFVWNWLYTVGIAAFVLLMKRRFFMK